MRSKEFLFNWHRVWTFQHSIRRLHVSIDCHAAADACFFRYDTLQLSNQSDLLPSAVLSSTSEDVPLTYCSILQREVDRSGSFDADPKVAARTLVTEWKRPAQSPVQGLAHVAAQKRREKTEKGARIRERKAHEKEIEKGIVGRRPRRRSRKRSRRSPNLVNALLCSSISGKSLSSSVSPCS
jgi:hypothetical protein